MAFVRIKKIKNYEYAYLVENSWKKKSSRQKVKEYLGRVIELDEEEVPFDEDISSMPFSDAVERIVEWQFRRWGFDCDEKKCVSERYVYNKKKKEIRTTKHDKPVVIKSHDGYMNKYTLKRLFNFEAQGSEEEIAYNLARAFVECGIFVDKELFISLFQKIYDVNKAMHR